MATPRHLSRAPVTEALLDIRASIGPSFNPARLLEAKQLLQATFPHSEEQKAAQVAVHAGQNLAATATDLGLRGVLLSSADQREVVQFRVDGFTFNRLKPYTRWEDILPKALSAWEKFVLLTEPVAVSRVAVRYINHIPVSGTHQDALGAVTSGLRMPVAISGELKHYQFRAQLSHPDGVTNANLAQTVELDITSGNYNVLVDIDVYRATPDLPLDIGGLAREFEVLRKYKNEIFFSTLTETTADRLT